MPHSALQGYPSDKRQSFTRHREGSHYKEGWDERTGPEGHAGGYHVWLLRSTLSRDWVECVVPFAGRVSMSLAHALRETCLCRHHSNGRLTSGIGPGGLVGLLG